MKCPTDGSILQLSERLGIEIDYCPTCRGVWLDRGELDKVIELSNRDDRRTPDVVTPAGHRVRGDDGRDDRPPRAIWDDDRWESDRDSRERHRPRKKRSLLGELFEFGD